MGVGLRSNTPNPTYKQIHNKKNGHRSAHPDAEDSMKHPCPTIPADIPTK